MKKHKQILFISLILILFTIICYFARLQQGSQSRMDMFLYELSKGNQIRSIIAGIVIWGLGLGTFINMNVFPNDVKMLFLFSVPTGIAFWCVLSISVLICEIKYCPVTMLFVCIFAETLIAIERKSKKSVLRYN